MCVSTSSKEQVASNKYQVRRRKQRLFRKALEGAPCRFLFSPLLRASRSGCDLLVSRECPCRELLGVVGPGIGDHVLDVTTGGNQDLLEPGLVVAFAWRNRTLVDDLALMPPDHVFGFLGPCFEVHDAEERFHDVGDD